MQASSPTAEPPADFAPPEGLKSITIHGVRHLSLRSRRTFWLMGLAWTLAVSASLIWNLWDRARATRGVATQVTQSIFEKDLLFREWATMHGGVYVPVTELTQPNPYLHVPERDIVTPAGKKLTLMNPAFMSRQIFEIQDQKMKILGHITSLKPIRPENLPDPWEREALGTFERGVKETVSFLPTPQGNQIRLMRPLVTAQGCLRCHADQGYHVGDIRGGISVTAPMSIFETPGRARNLALAHVGLWLLGCAGLLVGGRKLGQQLKAREQVEAERERLISELQEALAQVRTLSGLVPICAACKKIRDDRGFWHQVEQYVTEHSAATFTHGICPDCAKVYFPDMHEKHPQEGDEA